MKKLILIFTGLLMCVAQCASAQSNASAFVFPEVSHQWMRAAPPNAKMLAAYVSIENTTEQNLTLKGAFAPDFKMTEIHKTVEIDGMLKMREQQNLELPQHSVLVMEPGGLHIMLMMPDRKFVVGDEVKICLVYQDDSGDAHVQHLMFPVLKK